MKGMIIAFVAIVGILAAFAISDPRNRGFFPPQGYVASGGKFGVRIGDELKPSITRMRSYKGVSIIKTQKGGTCIFREYGPDYDISVFNDESWRMGVVCLVSKNERVAEIVWSYQLVGAFP
jgi:hypothetical protein